MPAVKGYVKNIVYRNADNGYTVLELVADGKELTCVGSFGAADVGDTLQIEGEYTQHPVYGEQMKAARYTICAPDDVISMQRYLGSGTIKGIGEALAARIVKAFGEDAFRVIEDEPERLAEVKGISMRKALDISIQMHEKKDLRDALIFLQGYGISNTFAMRIFEAYGGDIYHIIRENPYRLAEDIDGIGFRTADEIASRAGILVDSDYRLRSGLLYTLLQAAGEGDCYLPKAVLLQRTIELLGLNREDAGDGFAREEENAGQASLSERLDARLIDLMMDLKVVCKDGESVYAAQYYREEQACAAMLHALDKAARTAYSAADGTTEAAPFAADGTAEAISFAADGTMKAARYAADGTAEAASPETPLRRRIREAALQNGIALDTLQLRAVEESVRSGVVILTGGPGTGKTTTINAILQYYTQAGLDILLAAPTGRAAKRMTEATGYEAKTIHRLLEVNGQADRRGGTTVHFERNAEHPLEADAVIIDEMSMVDLHLFYALLQAIVPGTRLILVGDAAQLPSVGPGQVLRDLIASRRFPTIVLQKIFRQAEGSDIVVNAHRIHRGEEISLNNASRDFFFLERDRPEVIYKHMVELVRDKLPGYVNASPYEIQVLTPMRKGTLGVETLNRILQGQLNPANGRRKEHSYGELLFREGDKVMQIRNDYQAEWEVRGRFGVATDRGMGVFNGDLGMIVEINEYDGSLTVEFDERRRVVYPFAKLDALEPAYAVTIHKSQGSEYPAVILPLLSGPRMLLNRNLLYTAVTRAKSCVVILGSRRIVRTMIANEEQLRRYTGLRAQVELLYDSMG